MSHPKIVLEALRKLNKRAHINEISEACGLSYAQTSNALSDLVRVEPPRVCRVEKGVYQLIGSDTPQLPVKQHQLSMPAALPEDFPDTSDSPEAAAAYFADRLFVDAIESVYLRHNRIHGTSESHPQNRIMESVGFCLCTCLEKSCRYDIYFNKYICKKRGYLCYFHT